MSKMRYPSLCNKAKIMKANSNVINKYMINDKGFSLIELLMATAILSLIGLLILQVFMSSVHQNKKALELDKSVYLCVSVVERLKSENPSMVWNEEILKQTFPGAVVLQNGKGYFIYWQLSEQWMPYSLLEVQHPTYILTLSLSPDEETNEVTTVSNLHTYLFDNKKTISDYQLEQESLFSLQAVLPTTCYNEEVVP